MQEITLTLTLQEVNALLSALQKTDPTGIRAGWLAEKIVSQGNAQIPKEEEVKEE